MTPWVKKAIRKIQSDFRRSADTHLCRLFIPSTPNIDIYLKDESTHPTGSLKHRLARSLFLYGLCNGLIHEESTIIEASSGSTAVSEAYFCELLGLPFIAVIPEQTSQEKINEISFYGGKCHFVKSADIYREAKQLAKGKHCHYMDQFTFAERATDWRGNNNIAESIFKQMTLESNAVPRWVIMSAGTGGTSATIGRYIRYQGYDTQLCVADPTHSVFYEAYQTNNRNLTSDRCSDIEGIGRPRVEPSFIGSVIDTMIKVPDAAALATIHFLEKILNRRVGGSTGTNLYAAFILIDAMQKKGESGSVVTLICDSGKRYKNTYYNRTWLEKNNFTQPMLKYQAQINTFYDTGHLHSLR